MFKRRKKVNQAQLIRNKWIFIFFWTTYIQDKSNDEKTPCRR